MLSIPMMMICISAPLLAEWVAQDPGFDEDLHVVSYAVVDSAIIWAASGNDVPPRPAALTYSSTVDGGETWVSAAPDLADLDDFHITSIFALSDSMAWLTLAYNAGVPHRGKILKTVDAGLSWELQSTAYPMLPGYHNDPDFTFFFDEQDGITAGDVCEIYQTADGGTTWNRVPVENMPTVLDNEDPISASYWTMGDSTLWFGSSKGRVYRTTDRGNHWTAVDVGFGLSPTFVSFEDSLVGLATAPFVNATIARSIDGGLTWEMLPGSNQTPTRAILSYVAGTDSKYMYSTASIPEYLGTASGSGFTLDYGMSWFDESEMSMLPGSWVDATTGWAGSANDNNIYHWVGPVSISDSQAEIPQENLLLNNFPNPFNPSTTIRYGLPAASQVSLVIYDVRGNQIQTLRSEYQAAGSYAVVWNGETAGGNNISTGIYFARVTAGANTRTIKMLHLK